MNSPPQPPGHQHWIRRLRRWNAVCWVLLGLAPSAIGVQNDSGAPKYGALAVLAVLAAGYATAELVPGNRVLRPAGYLWVLALGLGAMAGLPGGGAALFIVSLPHFWIFARRPRSAVVLSGVAAAATVAGSIARSGEFFSGNAAFALIGYAAGVLVGLMVYRIVREGDERTHLLGAELEDAQQRLAEAHRRQGAVEERERLAREIHDTLAQGFASIIVLAEAARSHLATDPGRAAQQLLSIEQTARENFAEARVLVGSAPQSGLAPGSVALTLRRTLDRFAEDTGLTVDAELPDIDCDQQTRIALLRCTQESLANVRKHAAASTVGVVLGLHPHGVELEITDDGCGFVVEEAGGFGLDGMRKRLAELGGELTVTSSPGDGTRVLALLPANGQV
ncbi:sensor histidine kinase [Streptomyces rectiverticillatus]|uniref:sensor histidine kinase n=1 Tax=Streptomyces rectiverticillatus TaxID=173860 RepID=UPI0015C3AD47|nr:sensor histidine kinase [Streptomyces rectiverticillatus]QLE75624.1 sensor histidine kinase [Streptomyces rectiverticillatus]